MAKSWEWRTDHSDACSCLECVWARAPMYRCRNCSKRFHSWELAAHLLLNHAQPHTLSEKDVARRFEAVRA